MPAQCPARKPHLDFVEFGQHIATVLVKKLPAYTKPYPDGERVWEQTRSEGDEVVVVRAVDTGRYMAALTADGCWLNLWTLYNKEGERRGVLFAATRPSDELSLTSTSPTL